MGCTMRRLSSSSTFFYKRIFPVIWLFIPAVFVAMIWLVPQRQGPPDWMFVLVPLLMTGVGFVVFRKLIFDLLDEVWLDGDHLVLGTRGEKARVALRDVVNVNATSMTNPPRITLLLRTDSRFGRNVSFIPASPRGFAAAFKPDPIATELIERVDALRGSAR